MDGANGTPTNRVVVRFQVSATWCADHNVTETRPGACVVSPVVPGH